MFGYVTVCKPEMKMKEYYKYRMYYCGLCHELKDRYGMLGQLTLSYDMTFLVILLNSLYEEKVQSEEKRCIVHPIKRQMISRCNITGYVADMNILLTYYHLKDDWKDEKSIQGLLGEKILKREAGEVSKKYPRQAKRIKKSLRKLQYYENNNEESIDKVAGCFGDLMGELFVINKDYWEPWLRKLGFYLGKFIYIIDAYEDLEEDKIKSNYNPLKKISETKEYQSSVKSMLTMMMSACTEAFEQLPLINDVEILRNILYLGVWNKFDHIQREQDK